MSDSYDHAVTAPRRRIQWAIVLCTLVVGSLILVDCNGRHPTTTAQAARHGVVTHLQQIANSLPARTKLVARHPAYPHAGLGGGSLPASERGGDPDAPITLHDSLWVVPVSSSAVPEMRGASTYDMLLQSWRAQGYQVDIQTPTLASVDMPDGFTLVARVGGYDSMTVAVQSPRFPQRELDLIEPLQWPTLLVSDGSRLPPEPTR